jgi:hypothetical protein
LRSFHVTKRSEFLIMWTMQVWTVVFLPRLPRARGVRHRCPLSPCRVESLRRHTRPRPSTWNLRRDLRHQRRGLRHGSYSRRRYRSRGSTWTGLRRSHRAQPHGASRFDGCYVAQCDAKGSSRCVYDSGFSLMERGDGARLGCGRHRPSLDEDVHWRGLWRVEAESPPGFCLNPDP